MRKFSRFDSTKKSALAAGGLLSLAASIGLCTTCCGTLAVPIIAFLSTVGLGSLAAFIPSLQIPLISLGVLAALYGLKQWFQGRRLSKMPSPFSKSGVELIYFSGCPGIPLARKALSDAGIVDYSEIETDQLPADSPYRSFSSPTIIVKGQIVVGSSQSEPSCSWIDWDAARLRLIDINKTGSL